MNKILEEFSGEEKLYLKVLDFSKTNSLNISEDIILESYISIFGDLRKYLKINYTKSDCLDKYLPLRAYRSTCKDRIKIIAESIYDIIINIYPFKSSNIEYSERFKSYESIFMKRLFSKNVNNVSDIHDYFGIRFTVPDDNPELCYQIFEIINKLYIPYSSRYKDFIPMPNQRGYQTLQWTSTVPDLEKIEFQIRTVNMAKINDIQHKDYKDIYLSEENLNRDYLKFILKS